ncbi:hypothetical protein ASE39_21530 [Acidovorax sp. Root267]|uniref:hypothetical protein n=1 Tax=Acidovorax sp. Root267 TaxID=1736505 RepID=UPI00071094DF|nr:hypothetical protein [Acidovorax sp. Root267]KRD25511.1 hypothetical protein ASE39_21530 [Acidovorax sp. Root267]
MKQPLIVALTGKPATGKKTIASMLAPGQGFAAVSFTEAVQRDVAQAWRLDVRLLSEPRLRNTPLNALAAGVCSDPAFMLWLTDGGETLPPPRTPAWAMQRWGEFRCRFIPDFYCRQVERQIGRLVGCGWSRIVVPDLATTAQETMLRRLGAKVVRVHRIDLAAAPAQPADGAPGLTIKSHADIENTGSLEGLAAAVVECIDFLEVLVLAPYQRLVAEAE